MYANVALFSDPLKAGMFKSTNGAAYWSRLASTGDNEVWRSGYSQTVGVDPQDANRASSATAPYTWLPTAGQDGVTEATLGVNQ